MIENFINYIAHAPSDTTSPLYLELNTADMLIAQGRADKVTIYDNNAATGDTPYVKLSDKGQREKTAVFTSGGSYIEKEWLKCECVALGATALSAANRAEYLVLAVEGFVKALQADLSGLNERLDLGGTASSDRISNIYIGDSQTQPPVTGQGNQFTATRLTQVELWVYKNRQR